MDRISGGWRARTVAKDDLETGELAPVTGLPEANVHAVRAKAPDRFLLVVISDGDAISGELTELWEVEPDGTTLRIGEYPPWPAEVGPRPGAQLLPNGILYQIANGPRAIYDAIVRREIGGTTQVVYTEATEPNVEIHISGLITGP